MGLINTKTSNVKVPISFDEILNELNTHNTAYYAIFCKILDEDVVHKTIEFFRSLSSEIANIYIILHITNGGNTSDCAILTKLFLNSGRKITICVPEIAVSSGAQLALCGDSLVMGKYASLTPVDDQIDYNDDLGIYNIKRIEKEFRENDYRTLREYNSLIKAKYLRKTTKTELNNILSKKSKKVRKRVKKLFLKHKLYHAYPIDIEMVRKTGLEVIELTDEKIWKAFTDLYELW